MSEDREPAAGRCVQLKIRVERNGYVVACWPDPGTNVVINDGRGRYEQGMYAAEYVAADRDELAELVRRLIAEPPEGRAP